LTWSYFDIIMTYFSAWVTIKLNDFDGDIVEVLKEGQYLCRLIVQMLFINEQSISQIDTENPQIKLIYRSYITLLYKVFQSVFDSNTYLLFNQKYFDEKYSSLIYFNGLHSSYLLSILNPDYLL